MKKERSLSELCPMITYNYATTLFMCENAMNLHNKWKMNGLSIKIPGQVELYQGLPLLEYKPPLPFNQAMERCARVRGKLIEFDSTNDYLQIKSWAEENGYTCLVSNLLLRSGRPVWGSGDPYSFTWGDHSTGRSNIVQYMQDSRYAGMALWDLTRNVITPDYNTDIPAHCATLCHLEERPMFTALRSFFTYASVQLTLLEDMRPPLQEYYDHLLERIPDDVHSDCVPIKVDLVSPRNLPAVNMVPREVVSTMTELELQQQQFAKFLERYRQLHREVTNSLTFWNAQTPSLRLGMYFSGNNFSTILKHFYLNLGWNMITLLSMLAFIPVSILSGILVKKCYNLTIRKDSCTRYWMKKINRRFLRRGKKLKKREAAHYGDNNIEDEDDDEVAVELVPQKRSGKEVVPYRAGEIVPYRPTRRAPSAPRRSQFPEINDFS